MLLFLNKSQQNNLLQCFWYYYLYSPMACSLFPKRNCL